jgi:hypothetical protein
MQSAVLDWRIFGHYFYKVLDGIAFQYGQRMQNEFFDLRRTHTGKLVHVETFVYDFEIINETLRLEPTWARSHVLAHARGGFLGGAGGGIILGHLRA